jgi:hypothetical protein
MPDKGLRGRHSEAAGSVCPALGPSSISSDRSHGAATGTPVDQSGDKPKKLLKTQQYQYQVADAPAASRAKVIKHTSVVTTGPPEITGLPCAMVLTVTSCSPR